ncbi:MAG: hypothetical protein Q8N83_05430 [Ignavibacteria bacterium]|nr:hypothetical protein [Ignavibacteria bacterium]
MFNQKESTTDPKVSVFHQKDFMILRKVFTFNEKVSATDQKKSTNVRKVSTILRKVLTN